MSYPDGPGYVNFNPYTGAQDDVGPSRYDSASQTGDTVMVSFSHGDDRSRRTIRLAMRFVQGSWRIGNFIYPGNPPCHIDLARALARFAANLPDSGNCR